MTSTTLGFPDDPQKFPHEITTRTIAVDTIDANTIAVNAVTYNKIRVNAISVGTLLGRPTTEGAP